MDRVILHVDLDYFYAQLEELRKPELRNRPVAVCMFSGRTEFSGAVATANYMAREKGVKAGMPIALAKRSEPEIVLIRADREHYEGVSERIMDLLREYADKFEKVSIDEAFLDVTEQTESSFVEARKTAEKIKKRILEEEKLTCSIGMGPNKLIAKMASGTKKPNGLTIVTQREVKSFLRGMRIKDLHGIGPKTAELLSEKGITTIPRLAETPVKDLREWFGENKGKIIHEKSLGIDNSGVEEREQKQYSRIMTLKENTSEPGKLSGEAGGLARDLEKKARDNSVSFKTISIIMISDRLETVTRSRTLPRETQSAEEILPAAAELFRQFFSENPGFVARRFGLRISNFSEPKSQKTVFDFQ